MKHHVITIRSNAMSVGAAGRCISSGKQFDLDIKMFDAITPEDNPIDLALDLGINVEGFREIYSRYDNCVAAFMSHFTLWSMCAEQKEEFTIFEHDAFIVDNIPEYLPYKEICSLGKPSYGKWNNPKTFGVNPLTHKRYFGGAHAYRLRPYGAEKLIAQAKLWAGPTDVFLHLDRFPLLQEYYPWPCEARDTFTTIQKEAGCLAKHNYNETYRII